MSHVWTYQCGSRRSIEYGSTVRVTTSCSSGFRYSISTSLWSSIAWVSVATRSSSSPTCGVGRLGQLERAERLLELRAHAVERRVRAGGDHRADELEREPDRARLERRQPRRAAERVAEELLVDVHLVAVQLGVDRVAAAAEVDEVEQRQVLLELLGGDREAVDELVRGDDRLALLAAGGEQVGEQRLQHAEALRARPARRGARRADRTRPRRPRRAGSAARLRARARAARAPSATRRRSSDGSSGTARPSWRRIQRASRLERGVLGDEDVALDAVPRAAVRALDPPGGVGRDLDLRLADDVAELPFGPAAVVLDVELGRQAEVALAPRREADVGADARDAERADVVPLEVVADHVPGAVLRQERDTG